jgi:enoyl-[acyl-carrier protein] reductase I
MRIEVPPPALKGKKAWVIGMTNEPSIAYGCAKAFREVGVELAVTFLNDKAKPHVRPQAEGSQTKRSAKGDAPT